jgi:hypothetical protein
MMLPRAAGEMDSRELALLRLAAESEDHAAELEAIVDIERLMTVGSAARLSYTQR